jgi:hypothetical protein
LADLEGERDRIRIQLGSPPPAPKDEADARHEAAAATAAREAAERRLENVGSVPRRQGAAAKAVLEREWSAACHRDWKAQETLHGEQANRVVWDGWLKLNAGPMARYRELGDQIRGRTHTNETAALADPADYHLEALGPPPVSGTGRQTWAQTAGAIDSHRERWGVTGPEPLGPPPAEHDNGDQARQHRRVVQAIDNARRTRTIDRSLDQGMGI